MFDLKVKGNITVGELEVGFRKLGMRVTKQSIYLLIKRFDSDADGYWKYKLF
jgi:Ca2+-binding EF-hand superfamily protein